MQIRILRILEYVGDAESIYQTLDKSVVKRQYNLPLFTIRESIVGETSEILTKE
jgi:hypothetical protein